MSRILVVDDEPADRHLVGQALEKNQHEVLTAGAAADALKLVRGKRPDVAVLDIMLPDGNGLDILEKIREMDDHLPVVFVTSSGDSGTAIRAMKKGALDYLVKPIDIGELRKVVDRALEIRNLTDKRVELNVDTGSTDSQSIIGRCPAMQEVYKAIGIVAGQDVTVLIRGESGTGKELVARALYQYSDRVRGPFLAVNCAAVPETLLESELFGHERGSFTGADRKRIGKFEQCQGGTLFLDEIGDMSPVLQSKLLRVLQEKQFERVGGNETVTSDVRVIAATNRNLEKMVAEGEFRPDLYYRLNGFSIHLPPLRDRGDDLPMLVEHFRRLANHDLNRSVRSIAPEAMDVLRQYDWPGNIRELQNAIRQSILKTNGPVLLGDFLPDFVRKEGILAAARPTLTANLDLSLNQLINDRLQDETPELYDDVVGRVEQRLVAAVLEKAEGDPSLAAKLLGVDPELLRSRDAARRLGVERNDSQKKAPHQPIVAPGMTMAEIEREAIRRTLEQTDGCRKEAAKILGISTRTMQRRVKEFGLH